MPKRQTKTIVDHDGRWSLPASKVIFFFYTEVDTTKTRKGLNHVEENNVGLRNIDIPAFFDRC